MDPGIAQEFMKITGKLNSELKKLVLIKKTVYVYNPTEYAFRSYEKYIRKYCDSHKKIMFLGMNPGPWGMSQTGVPFGDISSVRDWLKIEETVGKPAKEHPARPVLGFSCQKTEVSGKRFWGLMKELCGEANKFFENCFVYNYLPLQFITSSGKNLPPTSLKPSEQELLFEVCDKTLKDIIKLYEVEIIVGIGKFAEKQAKVAVESLSIEDNTNVEVVSILHPSPQSKAANNWNVDVRQQLIELGIMPYLTDETQS